MFSDESNMPPTVDNVNIPVNNFTEKNLVKGNFLLSRSVFDNAIWTDKPAWWFKVWVHLLAKATYSKNSPNRGKLLTSVPKIFLECNLALEGIKTASVANCLKWLKSNQAVITKQTKLGMWVTICNYEVYQDSSLYGNQAKTKLEPNLISNKGNKENKVSITKERKVPKETPKDNPSFTRLFSSYPHPSHTKNKQRTRALKSYNSRCKEHTEDKVNEILADYIKANSGNEWIKCLFKILNKDFFQDLVDEYKETSSSPAFLTFTSLESSFDHWNDTPIIFTGNNARTAYTAVRDFNQNYVLGRDIFRQFEQSYQFAVDNPTPRESLTLNDKWVGKEAIQVEVNV